MSTVMKADKVKVKRLLVVAGLVAGLLVDMVTGSDKIAGLNAQAVADLELESEVPLNSEGGGLSNMAKSEVPYEEVEEEPAAPEPEEGGKAGSMVVESEQQQQKQKKQKKQKKEEEAEAEVADEEEEVVEEEAATDDEEGDVELEKKPEEVEVIAQVAATPPPGDSYLDEQFGVHAATYGVEKEVLMGISYCESHHNPGAANDIYGGMFQFSPATWQSTREAMGLDPNPDLRFDAAESIRTAAFKISSGGIGAWGSCASKLTGDQVG